jgi:hypothetical protein
MFFLRRAIKVWLLGNHFSTAWWSLPFRLGVRFPSFFAFFAPFCGYFSLLLYGLHRYR